MKTAIIFFSFILFAFSVSAQEISETESEKLITEYFNNIKSNNLSSAYNMLSAEDKRVMNLNEFRYDGSELNNLLTKAKEESDILYNFLNKNSVFKIKSIVSENTKITVTVELILPDIFNIAFDLSKAEPKLNNKTLSQKEKNNLYKRAFQKSYTRKKVPIFTISESLEIKKEDNSLIIFANLQKKADIKKAADLNTEAWNASMAKDYEKAVAIYKKAIELDPSNDQYKSSLKRAEQQLLKQQEAEKEKKKYISEYIAVKDLLIETKADGNYINIYFLNKGKKSVEIQKARLIYYKSGKTDSNEILDFTSGMMLMISPGKEIQTGQHKILKRGTLKKSDIKAEITEIKIWNY